MSFSRTTGDVIVARAALLRHVEKIEMEANGEGYVAKGNWNFLGNRARDGAGGLACTLQSPHTIQDRRGGMKPTKPTNAPAARFAMDGVGGPVCTILPQAKLFVDLAA